MGFRFRKSINLGGGIKLNLSKKGIGISAGTKGARISTGPSGTRFTGSIPGTGISYEKRLGNGGGNGSRGHSGQKKPKGCLSSILTLFFVFMLIGGLASSCGSDDKTPQTANVQTASLVTTQQSKPSKQESQSTPAKSPIPLIQATVTKVVDGDTIHATINGKEETVRLIGIDTPETHHPSKPVQPYGPEAENFTRSQLDGKQVWLEKDVQERDKYGRLLAYVWTSQPTEINDKEIREKMFNAKLALEGYAQQLTIPPDVKYSDYFTTYVREAREANKGLWGLAGTSSGQPTSNAPPSQEVTQSAPASAVNAAPAPVVNKQEVTVYVTKTGSKYHSAGCQYLRKSQIPMSLSDAKAAGYTPCSKCGPPR